MRNLIFAMLMIGWATTASAVPPTISAPTIVGTTAGTVGTSGATLLGDF